MNRRWKGLAGILLGAALLTAAVPVAGMDPLLLRGPNPLIGKPLADFEIHDIEGKKKTFSAMRGDNRVIMIFWATWCPHCRTQLDVIRRNHQKLIDSGVTMMLVNVGESRDQARAYLVNAGLPLKEGYLDQDGSVSNKLGVNGLPTYIFLDENGVVAAVQHQLPQTLSEVY